MKNGDNERPEEIFKYKIPVQHGFADTELILRGTKSELVETLRNIGETKVKQIQSDIEAELSRIDFVLKANQSNIILWPNNSLPKKGYLQHIEDLQNTYAAYKETYRFIEEIVWKEFTL